MRKGADTATTLDGIHAMVRRLNDHILPPGVKIVPYLDRDDLVHYTTHTVLHNLAEGMILVVIILFIFLGNIRGALIVALTIPFALLFASICLDLRHISANLLSLGALDFGMVVDGAVVMVENIVRHLHRPECRAEHTDRASRHSRARSAAARLLCHRHHHHGLSAHLYLATGRRKIVPADGVDRGLRFTWRADVLDARCARSGEPFCFARACREWQNPVMEFLTARYRKGGRLGGSRTLADGWSAAVVASWARFILAFSGVIGSEFLPHLDEGAIWVRGTLAPSTGPTEGGLVMERARQVLLLIPGGPAGGYAKWDARTTARTPPASSIRNTSSTCCRRKNGGRSSIRTKNG